MTDRQIAERLFKLKPADDAPKVEWLEWIEGVRFDAINGVMRPGEEAEKLRKGIEDAVATLDDVDECCTDAALGEG